MNRRVQPSRPPGQYVVAAGTQYCLVANEYDKNKYAQCTYISHRTRIRCNQIRPKEELGRNNGICEEHGQLQTLLRENHQKEMLRVKSECDNMHSRRKKYTSIIVTNEYVSDEDDWLEPATNQADEFPDQLFDNPIEEEPLRYAGVFTEKDVLRMKMNYVGKDIEELQSYREYMEAHASKLWDKIDDQQKPVTIDVPHYRAYDASNHYGKKDYIKYTEMNPIVNTCTFGRNPTDAVIIADIVEGIVCDITGEEKDPMDEPCENSAVDLSDFCFRHILLDNEQQLFTQCTVCSDSTVFTNDPTCTECLRNLTQILCSHSIHEIRRNEEDVRTPGQENALGAYRVRNAKATLIDSSSEDEDFELTNLSHMETMPCPLQPLPSPSARRYYPPNSTVSAMPPRQHVGVPYPRDQSAAQRVAAAVRSGNAPGGHMREPTVDMSSGCAREREFSPAFFNKIKPEEVEAPKKPMRVGPTPRVLPSSRSSFGMPSMNMRGGYGQHRAHPYFGAPHASTRFPITTGPKTIPLERTQEPSREAAEGELVEDRRTPPPVYPGMMDVPRKVPYVNKSTLSSRRAAEHRQVVINAMPPPTMNQPTSQTSAPRQAPQYHHPQQFQQPQHPQQAHQQYPHQQQPHPPRPPYAANSGTALPPHRAIAMGMKPSEMTLPSTPRPSFTPQTKSVPYQYPTPNKGPPHRYLTHSPMQGGSMAGPSGSQRMPDQPQMVHPSPYLHTPPRYSVKSSAGGGKYAAMDMSHIVNDSKLKNLSVRNFLKMGGVNGPQDDVGKKLELIAKNEIHDKNAARARQQHQQPRSQHQQLPQPPQYQQRQQQLQMQQQQQMQQIQQQQHPQQQHPQHSQQQYQLQHQPQQHFQQQSSHPQNTLDPRNYTYPHPQQQLARPPYHRRQQVTAKSPDEGQVLEKRPTPATPSAYRAARAAAAQLASPTTPKTADPADQTSTSSFDPAINAPSDIQTPMLQGEEMKPKVEPISLPVDSNNFSPTSMQTSYVSYEQVEGKLELKEEIKPVKSEIDAQNFQVADSIPQLVLTSEQPVSEAPKEEETSRKRKNEEPSISSTPAKKRVESELPQSSRAKKSEGGKASVQAPTLTPAVADTKTPQKPATSSSSSSSSATSASKAPIPTGNTRTPRAAAIAANQAITSKTPAKEEAPSKSSPLDPLNILAAVSEIELEKEQRREKSASLEKSDDSPSTSQGPASTPSPSKKTDTTTTETPTVRRRSSRGKGKEE